MVEFEDNLTDLVRTQMHSFKSVLISTLATALVLVTFPAAAVVGSGSTPVDLSATGGDAGDPQVTVSSTGLVSAVWFRWNGSHNIIQSSTSQNGGAWSTPVDLSATGASAYEPQVTVSSTGLVTAVWYRYDGSHNIIQSSTLSNSTPPTTPAATTTPKLATTGANVEWLMVAGLIAAIAGAGFLTVSRRKRSA
jgi:LPXTG-motif cell wall-anchored protein